MYYQPMSTQVRFADCISWKTPRPYLIPDWFSANPLSNPHTLGREQCRDNEPPRRQDRLPQRYGKGVASVPSAVTDVHGVPYTDETDFIIASTQEGSVKIPVHVQARHYTPTIEALDFLTHTSDTRLQAQPSRYYR